MLILLLVAVIFINNFIEQRSEGVVRVVGASVNTDAGLGPLGAGEDGLLKCESMLIFLVLKLLPDGSGEALLQEGLCAGGEVREVSDVLGALKVRTHESASGLGVGDLYPVTFKPLSSS